MDYRQQFIEQITPFALDASKRTGVDPRIIIAQAAVESNYGRSAPGNNYFGIKAPAGSGQSLMTTEYVGGQAQKMPQSFRTYESMEDSVKGYADFINKNQRYEGFRSGKTMEDQLTALQKSGYATAPNYGAVVGGVAKNINIGDQPQAPATQMADVKGYLAPSSAANLAPAGTWSRFGQDVLGGISGGLMGTSYATPSGSVAQPTQVASAAPVAMPQGAVFPSATPGMAPSVALPPSVGQPTMPQMAGLNAGGGYQAPPASAMQPASQSLFNPPAAGTPMANANALAGLANVGLGLMAAGAEKPSWQPGAAAPVHRGQWRDNIFGLLG
jgi:hypothetical protein